MEVEIRLMKTEDDQILADAFFAQGWIKSVALFEYYFSLQEQDAMDVLVALVDGEHAGYITLVPNALVGPFASSDLPEIGDLNVLKKFQRQGVGSKLMDAAEERAMGISDSVTLAVGMHAGYGSAQRMYVKRGYVPDGSGAWYNEKPLEEYMDCRNDDFLCLYLKKDFIVNIYEDGIKQPEAESISNKYFKKETGKKIQVKFCEN